MDAIVLYIQSILKFFPFDLADRPVTQIATDVVQDPMLNRHGRGSFPLPSRDFKPDIANKVLEAHFGIRFPLTIVDRADNLGGDPTGVLFVNPGSADTRRFKLPISVARLIVDGVRVDGEIVELNNGR